MSIKNNTTSLQSLLEAVNALPEASTGGVELPTLTNEGSASDLLSGKQLIDQDGNAITGAMTNNGTVSKTLNTSTTSYTIPQGYHSGSGKVSITTETKSVTPTKSTQTVTPTSGKVLSSVSVAAIPSQYITTTDATASADKIMSGETAYVNGSKITGTFSIDSELTTQDDLIAQIQSAVDSLPEAGGSSGGSASYDTYTLQINNQSGYLYCLAYTSVENGEIVAKYLNTSDYSTSITCLCGSTLCCYLIGTLISTSITKIGIMDGGTSYCNAYRVDASANETIIATVSFNASGGGAQ